MRSQESGVRSQKSEVRSEESGVRSQKPEVRSQKSGVGFRKRGRNDKARFLNIAQGSLEECRYYLILAADLGYLDSNDALDRIAEVSKLLERYCSAILTPDF